MLNKIKKCLCFTRRSKTYFVLYSHQTMLQFKYYFQPSGQQDDLKEFKILFKLSETSIMLVEFRKVTLNQNE